MGGHPSMDNCCHDPFVKNTLIVEAHWAAGVRIRCRVCGSTSYVSKKGRVKPHMVAVFPASGHSAGVKANGG